MSSTSHSELIGHSSSQVTGTAVVDGTSNIIIMENNIINCGEPNNKYIITSTSSTHQQQPQQILLSSGNSTGGTKKASKVSTQQRHISKSSMVVSNKSGHQMIMTNAPNIVASSPVNHKEQRMYTVQQTKTPKSSMYTSQQVYTTNVMPQGSGNQQSIQSQQQKNSTMPRNVQAMNKNSNNLVLNQDHPQQHSYIQKINESNQHQSVYNSNMTPTMKTIYINNNTGGLNFNKSSTNNKILTPIDYSAIVEQQQKQGAATKHGSQKVMHSSSQNNNNNFNTTSNCGALELVDGSKFTFKVQNKYVTNVSSTSSGQATSTNSPNSTKMGNVKNYINNCTINVQQSPQNQTTTQYYYQPSTVYTTDPSNSKVSSTTTKIVGKTVQQQQQYIQIQNQRVTSNNYVTTTTHNPAPAQKHRTTTPNKYIIQNVQSNAIPVSSVNSCRQQSSAQPTVINYSNNNITNNNTSNEQPSVIQSPVKMRTVLHPIEAGMEDGARIYTVHSSGEAHLVTTSTPSMTSMDEANASPRFQSNPNLGFSGGSENFMMVNGTKMTDEMSARILHDLSQRSSIKYSGSNNNASSSSSNYNRTSNNNGSNSNGSSETPVQLGQQHHPTNVYATRQIDGNIVWNGGSSIPPQEQYIRKTSESSTYTGLSSLPTEYQRQTSNNMSSESHIIYQPGGIIVERSNSNGNNLQHQVQDEELVGIEVRPSPIPLTSDGKLSILHTVYQDHTYCAPMTPRLLTVTESTFSTMNPNLESNTVAAAAVLSSMPGAAKLFNRQSAGGVTISVPSQQLLVPQIQQRDDDANSTISTGSHSGLYIDQGEDPGEETETALEGEGEEDSETRCICELTHDDGYMICCDTCSSWQHVDCMKIDRQNIPEEYQCVNCCPREVDALAARTLQLQKRKEQSALQLYPIANLYEGIQSKMMPGKYEKKNNLVLKQKKKDLLGKKNKKDLNNTKNNKRSESNSRINSKRKDVKRMSKKKLKQLSDPNCTNTPDKLTSTLRNWIDNYEIAVTNHYSPELRARLQSLGKQSNNSDGTVMPEPKLQWMDTDGPICTTVPHAGAKILISTRNIDPHASIIEIQGKYMLDTQQNKSNNAMLNATRKPSSGPFLFFYSVPRGNLDICVDTRTYGNEARFIRRSCRPNAEILHKIEKNSIHLYIVARYKIMEGAEITIAHDQNVDPLTRTNSMSHTSTLCACGLVRDCKFAAALSAASPLSSPPHSAPPLFTQNAIKRKNGTHTVGIDGIKEKRKYKKRKEKPSKDQKENRSRGRSTSSSAESHAGLMSPPLKNFEFNTDFLALHSHPNMVSTSQIQIITHQNTMSENTLQTSRPITPAIQEQQHIKSTDEPTLYENSGLLKQQLDAPHQEPSLDLHQLQHSSLSQDSLKTTDQIPSVLHSTVVKDIPIDFPKSQPQGANTSIQLPIIHTISPVQQQPSLLHSPTAQVHNTSSIVPSIDDTVNKTEITPKTPPQKAQKRSHKSHRNSIHESSTQSENTNDETANTPTKDDSGQTGDKETSTSHEKRKLTREERKMEAIVKAFEKMEKTQQRKQEQKAHKTTPKKPKSLISSSSSVNRHNNILNNKRKMMNQRRKKRKSKSNSTNKRADRHSGDSSDVATSSEENIIKQSKSINSLSYQTMYDRDLLSSYSKLKAEADTNLSGISTFISPACMLVEAAVGDLEPSSNSVDSFKLPHKTKTKKALMNEWLTKTDSNSTKLEQDSDIKSVAKKVEEFIVSNNMRYIDDEPLSLVKQEHDVKNIKNSTTSPQSSSPQAEQASFAGSESAVKKRWLRQAISEETNDESCNSQQTEFTTPLKKRRVVIEQTDSANSSTNTLITKMDEVSQESSEENVDDLKPKVLSSYIQETKSNLLTLEDVEVYEKPLKIEVSSDELLPKKEESLEETVKNITNSIKTEEIEDEKSSNSDEMAHLHKVVASFHSESLLMLQSRNKKSSGTTSLPETPKKANQDIFSNKNSPASEPELKYNQKSVSPDTTTQEPCINVREPEIKSNSITTSILAQTLTSTTTPVAETIPFGSSRYLSTIQRSEIPSILAGPSLIEEYTPTSDYRTSFTYRPMMTNLTMNEYPEPSVPPQEQYIPSYNKATLIAATTPTGATLTGQFAPAFSSGFVSNDIGSVVSGTTSSSFLGKSYSTLNDTNAGTGFYGQKIYTKTAVHDPRLNPSLVEEQKPLQPKKKLSLTEYRKRKAQSTDSTSNDGTIENNTNCNNLSLSIDETSENGSKVSIDDGSKDKLRSPSPTRNSSDESSNVNDETSIRCGNVTPTPCNFIENSIDLFKNSEEVTSYTPPINPDIPDESPNTNILADRMTTHENITGSSPTENDANSSSCNSTTTIENNNSK
uniref:CSON009779 protein n=1 Tax=Culicoides sonorensis TaxID=179676 RepID=A0A336M3I8_CULSO